MDSNDQFWIRLFAIFAILIICVVTTISWYNAYTTRLYVEHGYNQKTVVGQMGAVWTRE